MSEKKPRESFSLKTDDIQGAKPSLKQYSYTNKLSYSNSVQGIEKSSPSIISLKTSRSTNPLIPEYKLPTYTSKPITPPKFIRDTLDTADISKGKPASSRQVRNSLDVSDIIKKPSNLTQKSFLYTNNPDKQPIVRRNTNPLNPEYLITGENNKTQVIGEVPGSKPKVLINVKKPAHNRSLDVSDIQGTPLKNASSSITFATPKLKLKDLISNFSGHSYKISSNSAYNSPKAPLSCLNSPSMSVKASPNASIAIPQQVIKKKLPLPKSPRSIEKFKK